MSWFNGQRPFALAHTDRLRFAERRQLAVGGCALAQSRQRFKNSASLRCRRARIC